MSRSKRAMVGVACGAMVAASFVACARSSRSAEPPSSGSARSSVQDDVKGVAKATEKAAKDVGHATADLAEKAGKGLEDVTSKAGVSGQDAWITTKVKSELASDGFDPLHVHVDTDAKVVTLSGTVESGIKAQRAVAVAKAVTGVISVRDHLFVKPVKQH